MIKAKVDRPLLIITTSLVVLGFFAFISASMWILTKDQGSFLSMIFSQVVFGLIGGGIAAILIIHNLKHKILNKYSLYLLIAGIILTLLVFVPGISLEHGGARRWLLIGPFSFQPVEVLKIAMVIYWASWLSGIKKRIEDFRLGMIPFCILIGIAGTLLLLQPDTDNFLVIAISLGTMFFIAGAKMKDLVILALVALIGIGGIVMMRPYIKDRIMTFINPSTDPLGSGYQIQQSLIAVGSGGIFGKGFGQSVQKFSFLPEPVGDSIFAVFAEEWGFVGGTLLIILFILFAIRSWQIAERVHDDFGKLLIIGFSTIAVTQSFLNIGAMIGALPLAGIPLIFVSKGGTALLFALVQVGIILNISKTARN